MWNNGCHLESINQSLRSYQNANSTAKLIYIPWQFLNDSNPHLNVQTTLLTDWTLAWHVYDMLHQNKIPSPLTFIIIAAPLNSRILTLISKRDTEKTRENFQNFQNKSNQPSEGKFIVLACVCDHCENVNAEDEKLCKLRKISTKYQNIWYDLN